MKLRNKKTGEIREVADVIIENLKKNGSTLNAISIDEIKNEWEDYEEPKEYWFIDYDGGIIPFDRRKETATDRLMKSIGNYFETKEEVELAVRKLKAWKRLKDKGFRFKGVSGISNEIHFTASLPFTHIMIDEYTIGKNEKQYVDDLLLLFGE